MPELTHEQLLLILAIAAAPGVLQAVIDRRVHGLWLAVVVAAGIFVVASW